MIHDLLLACRSHNPEQLGIKAFNVSKIVENE